MTAGASAAERAAAARKVAKQRQREAEKAARVAGAWEAGQVGEEHLAAVLDRLAVDGYHHLADRALPTSSANIDHLLVGPAGIFAIDAKNWSGSLSVGEGGLRQDGHRRMKEVQAAAVVASTVADVVEAGLQRVPVWAALCFVGEARIGDATIIDRVKLLDVDDVQAWVRHFPSAFSATEVIRARDLLVSQFPAKTAESSSAIAPTPPSDLVVYLVPWKKAGRHRLYVRSSDGSDVGYLDLVTGHCSSPSPEWEAILAQLLPHYLKGDTPGMQREDLSEETQGVIRRFLDSLRGQRASARPQERPIIACYRWKRHGHDRLYLSRLEPGGVKTELGSFDLDSGLLRANGPGVAGTLGYCGERFRQLEQQRLPFS